MARLLDLYDASFNPDDVEASRQMDPIPEGDYVMQVTKAELNETQARTGYRLDVEFTILDGQHTDRRLYTSLNVSNPNKQAEAIALGELKRLCIAAGVDFNSALEESDNLLFQPFMGHVVYEQDMVKNSLGQKGPKIDPKTGQPYPPRNRVKRFNSLDGADPAPAPTQAAPAPAARPAATPVTRPAALGGPAKTNPFNRK